MVFINLCILLHWTKVASVLGGLIQTCSKSRINASCIPIPHLKSPEWEGRSIETLQSASE